MGDVSIYTINDPITGMVRYVGKTKNPSERFRKHLTSKNTTTKCRRWITGLLNKGLKPVFEIIDTCRDEDWQQKERQYIMIFKSVGANLLNQLPGGEGGATMLGKKLSPEQIQKIVDSKIGKPNPAAIVSNKVNKGIKVQQLKDGKLIATYVSIYDAAKAVNRSPRRIQMMVSGKGKKVNHVGGFQFSMLK